MSDVCRELQGLGDLRLVIMGGRFEVTSTLPRRGGVCLSGESRAASGTGVAVATVCLET